MDMIQAKKISALVNRKEKCERILECLNHGYPDEWEIRNTHTGTCVDITSENWEEIKNIFKTKLEAVNQHIKELK